MKKFLALAALVLGLASCQTEPEGLDVNVGGAVDTEITVSLPDMTTRAGGSNSATSDINAILATDDYTMRYMLQVFYGDKPSELYVRYSDNQKVSFPVRLVPGEDRDYNFVVWADIVEQVADLKDDVKCDDLHYAIGADLRDISVIDVIDNKWVAMDETRDAFTAVKLVEDYTGSQAINIDLYRPFAKLRVITTDMVELTKHDIIPTTAVVTYKTKHRVAYNALTGEAADASATKEHSYTIAPYGDNTETDRVLFTDYFFVDDEVVQFDMLVKDQNGKEIVTRSFNTDIFVQRNYLTTLKGDILTNGTDVNVEVKPGFGDIEWPNTLAGELAKAAMLGGEVTLTEDVVLEESLNVTSNMVINLNGHTITGPSEAKDANGNKIHTIVNNGDLTVNGGTIESVAENGGSAICNNAGANLTINNVEINGAPLVDGGWPSYGINNYGTMTINGAKVNTYHGGIATGGNGIAIIEDATVDVGLNTQTKQTSWALYVFDNGQMTVNGGTFKNTKNENGQVYGGGYICAISTSKTIINGGTFDKTEGDNNGTGFYYQCKNLEIKGGTFDVDPSKHVADGYQALQYETNGFYTVQAIDAATRTITINSLEEYLNLNALNDKWVEFFSNGQGKEYSNYATQNGGKGTDFYYKWGWTIKLNTDIDLKDVTALVPTNLESFGYFDGNGHTIKNATITTTSDAGLFRAGHAAVKNLNLYNIKVNGGNDASVGILTSDCHASVDNITIVNSSAEGGKYVGGAVGYGYCDVTNCTLTNCVVKGSYKFGGVIGYICASNDNLGNVDNNTLTDCTVEWTGNYSSGKDTVVMGKVVGNFNCDGTCNGNVITNMTTTATSLIGKIEAGKNVEGQNSATASNTDDLKEALKDNTVTEVSVTAGEYTFPASDIKAGTTIICEEGTVFKGTSSLNIKGATVIGATFKNDNGIAVRETIHGNFKNCTFDASEALRWCYSTAGETSVFENCVVKTDFRGVHFDGLHGTVIFKNCEINGFNAFGGNGEVIFENCTMGCDQSSYNGLNLYLDTTIIGCKFIFLSGKTNFIDMEAAGKTLTIKNCTATLDGAAANIADYVGGSQEGNCTVTIE